MLNIKTNQLKTRKRVLIDDHEYVVRNLGNIEQLELSQIMRTIEKLAALEKSSPNNKLTDKQTDEVDALTKSVTDMFIGLFDDGGDQTKSRKLIASLSDTEITLLLKQIFEDNNAATEVS